MIEAYTAHIEDADSEAAGTTIAAIERLADAVRAQVPPGTRGHWRIEVSPVGNRTRLELEFHVDEAAPDDYYDAVPEGHHIVEDLDGERVVPNGPA